MKALSALVGAAVLFSSAPCRSEGALDAAVVERVRAGRPLVVYVVIPLCSNAQIDCGSTLAGRPGDLAHNLYWGAIFGARRFFDRPASDWNLLSVSSKDEVFLERAIYRRFVDGAPWGSTSRVEEIVVLQAIHGDAIDKAVDHLYRVATEGGSVAFRDGETARTLAIDVVGYAGHNRLMDGKKFPAAPAKRAPIPSFVLACESDSYFGSSLARAGSTPLVMTDTLMAPEGYLVDAIARGLGANASPAELRRDAVAAYAKWQRLSLKQAGSVFTRR